MPIIVDEVVISVEVTNPGAAPAKTAPGAEERQALVEACAERVLDILKQKGER
jgi:hypothetical protein